VLLLALSTVKRASVVYGEGPQLPSRLHHADAQKVLVALIQDTQSADVATEVVQLLSQLSSTGTDDEIDRALVQLAALGVVGSACEATLRHSATVKVGHYVCELLHNFLYSSADAVATVLNNSAFTDHVINTLLDTDCVFWFEDHMPAVMLMGCVIARGERDAARLLIERDGHRMIRKLCDCITDDDRGEGTIQEWLLAADEILRCGVDGVLPARVQNDDDDDDDDDDDEDEEEHDPLNSKYAVVFEQLGVKAIIADLEGGGRLLSTYFGG
jgi:hypothetical protein